ncbi:tetratricopeptide repeat protein [Fundidesulfovibrio putealis]|uniref:tetratricopeptide repeat protein n=1 Tax=Fundidesulfovibrio putealis TaxID=270496 RepID=UPI0005BC5C8E|nr:tetratricopeptide repeat protein [Fundidesulfovibrio putealis]
MNTVRVLVMLAMVLCVSGGESAADPFNEAREAVTSGDYEKAFGMYKVSAEQGNVSGMFYLGVMYDDGIGIQKNYYEAMKWYNKAAELGDHKAMFNIGMMYYIGEWTPQNYAEAMRWFRKSAELGDVKAMFNLGMMNSKVEGVARDYVQAHKWFNIAAAGGDETARKNRDELAKMMTPTQIAQAQKLAAEWNSEGKP